MSDSAASSPEFGTSGTGKSERTEPGAATTRLRAITHKLISGPNLTGGNRPYLLWFGWSSWWHFNVHSNETCRLCFTIGPVGFRWFR